jgi:Putative transposase DNA-binding domain/Helix-turn-helix domain
MMLTCAEMWLTVLLIRGVRLGERRRFAIPEGWVTRGFRFEVEPTHRQQPGRIAQHFGARRYAYNWALAQVKANLEARKQDPSVPALAGMGRRAFRRSVTQAGIGRIRPMLAYKCPAAGGRLVVADRWFASSKTHHGCGGYLADLRLGQRIWVCPKCGNSVDRNANAALNLRDWTGPVEGDRVVQRGGVAAPVPLVGDHRGQAHMKVWACEAPQDHREVAGATDTRTEPGSSRRARNPEQRYQPARAHQRSLNW